jgi:hypothetical protein
VELMVRVEQVDLPVQAGRPVRPELEEVVVHLAQVGQLVQVDRLARVELVGQTVHPVQVVLLDILQKTW